MFLWSAYHNYKDDALFARALFQTAMNAWKNLQLAEGQQRKTRGTNEEEDYLVIKGLFHRGKRSLNMDEICCLSYLTSYRMENLTSGCSRSKLRHDLRAAPLMSSFSKFRRFLTFWDAELMLTAKTVQKKNV